MTTLKRQWGAVDGQDGLFPPAFVVLLCVPTFGRGCEVSFG